MQKMNANERLILFLSACLISRSLVAFTTWKSCNFKRGVQIALGVALSCVAVGLFYNFVADKRIGGFGGVVWWKKYRLVHSILYITPAIFLFTNNCKFAWVPLSIDVLFGLTVGLIRMHSLRDV